MKSFKKSTLCQAVGLASFVLAMPAFADDTEVSVNLGTLTATFEDNNRYATPSSTGSAGLNLSNRETPQMVSVLNHARMKDQNLKTMKDVMDNTAGLSVKSIDGGRVSFASRGFDINQFSVDGADIDFNQQMSIGEYHLDTSVYEKIEVTHGATGLVSGSGEPSARINLVRKKAHLPERKTSLSANANKFGNYGVGFDHNQSLTKDGTVRGRVVLNHQDGETFIDREKKGSSIAYATVQADLGEKATVDVGAMYSQNKQRSVMWGGLPSYYTDGTKTDWDVGKNNSVDWAKWDRQTQEYFANLEYRFNDNWQANVKTSYSQNEGSPKLFYHGYTTVDKATGLGVGDPKWIYSMYRADNDNKQIHVQADVSGRFDLFGQTHQAILGGHYNKHNLTAYQYPSLAGDLSQSSLLTWNGSYPEPNWGAKPDTPAAEVESVEKSVYGAMQLKLADPLSVVLGSRLSEYNKEGVQWGSNVTAKAKQAWTPYAGVIYDFSPNSSVYASYTSIFKPQERRDIDGNYLDPVEGNTYEIGVKGSSDDGKLQSQFAIFRTEQDNVSQSLGEGVYVRGTENALREQAYTLTDGTVSEGVEVEVTGKLSPNWQMMAGFTQFRANDAKGDDIHYDTSKRMIKLFTIYDFSRLVNGLSIGGGVNWYDSRYALIKDPVSGMSAKYTQKPVTIVNLMGRYAVNKDLDVQLNISNALNQKYLSGLGNFGQIIYAEPLNVSGSVTYRF